MTMTSALTTGRPDLGVAAVELTGLHKSFGAVDAVRGVDLTIQPGEVVAFLGPNGAGKTSTIDVVLGLSEPTRGQARVFGLEPQVAVRHGLVAAVMQTGGLLKDLTVRDTVRYCAALFPHARSVAEVMDTAGITHLADRVVGKCSGGEQQRLRFAMALVGDPELVILDEPTTGMDVTSRRGFWESIRADAQRGRTVLFATHYLDEADAYADRVVLISRGQIVADGTSAQIKALGSGRTVRASWAGMTEQELPPIPGADRVDLRGDQLLVAASDSDAVARFLLTHTPARDLEITSRGLEDAFLALTSDDVTPKD